LSNAYQDRTVRSFIDLVLDQVRILMQDVGHPINLRMGPAIALRFEIEAHVDGQIVARRYSRGLQELKFFLLKFSPYQSVARLA